MWIKFSHTLYPCTKLSSPKVKFESNEEEKNADMEMKNIMGRDFILS